MRVPNLERRYKDETDETGITIRSIHLEIILAILLVFFLLIDAEMCMVLYLNLCL